MDPRILAKATWLRMRKCMDAAREITTGTAKDNPLGFAREEGFFRAYVATDKCDPWPACRPDTGAWMEVQAYMRGMGFTEEGGSDAR